MDRRKLIENPYRPGAGHSPPFLAGRSREQDHFRRLLRQNFTTENILITGLRGMGKTVLLCQLRIMAEREGWIWVGNDLSESSSLTEERLAIRILTDISEGLARVLSKPANGAGAAHLGDPTKPQDRADDQNSPFAFEALRNMYERAPGLPSDRLRNVLSRLGSVINGVKARGILFSYDEAQCLSDHAERNEFPMSLLIETIASLQKKEGVSPYLLVLCGLPQVFDALTETRTYTERMFHVVSLDRLSRDESFAAFMTPLQPLMPPLHASKDLIDKAVDLTGGYPYLIQFFGKELVDQLLRNGGVLSPDKFPSPSVMDRLDSGLFAARWNKTTDKQREVLRVIASRAPNSALDFSAQEIAALSLGQGDLTNAQATQMLQALCERGLLYRTRHGRYAFTVPMSETMILRRFQSEKDVEDSWLTPKQAGVNGTGANGHADTAKSGASAGAQPTKRWRWFR